MTPMGEIFTLFYLYDNLNKDNVTNESFLDVDFNEFSEEMRILNRDIIKAPDELVNRVLELTRDKNY